MFNFKEKKDILYFYNYGDQHHSSSQNLEKGEKVISDGGSNIHTNFLLKIKDKYKITIFTYKDNYQVRNFFSDCSNILIIEFGTLSALFKKYLLKLETVTRCFYPGLIFLFKKINVKYLVTQTDFLPDTFAAFLAKIRNPQIEWIATFFLAAPVPWDKTSPYKGKRFVIGLCYWLLQAPSIWFIKAKADKILVTSEPDIDRFVTKRRDRSKIIPVQGGVNIEESEKYLKSDDQTPVENRKYEACFSGRFHYQKGVTVLIDIWYEVCKIKPAYKLAMIGVGPLEADVKEKIKQYGLENNIDLLGFMGGQDKFEIFKNSKIMVHPATYDSGGMAAAEGLAWALPGVSFDLEALKTYYPKGMIKTPEKDIRKFAENVVELINNSELYNKTKIEALELIREVWDWNKRAERMERLLFDK